MPLCCTVSLCRSDGVSRGQSRDTARVSSDVRSRASQQNAILSTHEETDVSKQWQPHNGYASVQRLQVAVRRRSLGWGRVRLDDIELNVSW